MSDLPVPDIKPRWYVDYPTVREVHGVRIDPDALHTDQGAVPIPHALEWLLDKTAYANAPNVGQFDRVFRYLTDAQARDLAIHGVIKLDGLTVRRRANRGDAAVTVRRGNRYGMLVNGASFLDAQDPAAIRQQAQECIGDFASLGMLNTLAMPGQTARNIAANYLITQGLRSHTSPPPLDSVHTRRFLAANRGGRMESVRLGKVEASDYDIRSAFPAEMSRLVSLQDARWVDSPDLTYAKSATYAAIQATVRVHEHLDRGPVGVRVGPYHEDAVFYPVGRFEAWLNLPEVRLLMDHPELGSIERVHQGSWCLTRATRRPYAGLMNLLFRLRRQGGPVPERYWKRLSVAIYGILGHHYPVVEKGRTRTQAGTCWNPVFMGAVTSAVRVRNYLASLENEVVGEYIDGVSLCGDALPLGDSQGDYRLEGKGEMHIWSDQFKGSHWKALPWDIEECARRRPNAYTVDLQGRRNVTLGDVAIGHAGASDLGRDIQYGFRFRPGSTARMSARRKVAHYLNDQVHSRPPLPEHMEGLYLLRRHQFDGLMQALWG